MTFTPQLLPQIIAAVDQTITDHGEEVTALDQAIGDGDHLINLQRGLAMLKVQADELSALAWPVAWQKIGMILMSTVGGASGSLYGTLFIALSKAAYSAELDSHGFAAIFALAVEAVKQRGKSDAGEKTLLDVYIPVADYLKSASETAATLPEILATVPAVAIAGMESTRDMLATKGRASFLDERSLGHIDAGAKTAQLMVCAIAEVLAAAVDKG